MITILNNIITFILLLLLLLQLKNKLRYEIPMNSFFLDNEDDKSLNVI